ncbi:YdgA family protein [Otariodibacter sp.]|uniref:YdgA family protein n=1 Tax=Otariodibacter sp. TaxID=3030919 RepID=UPI0026173605|nr:YdgA family protein [Otariodibacter sp.]
MKISTIAISTIVVLGIAATGGSWYSGKQVEEHYQEWVSQGNGVLKKLELYGIQAEIKDMNLKRHFFSSDTTYNIEAKVDGETYIFKGQDKLNHGPFPLNRLLSGNIVPAMASIESHITIPTELRQYFTKDELLSGISTISYGGDISGSITTQQFSFDDAHGNVSAVDVDFAVDKSGKTDLSIQLPLFKVDNAKKGLLDIQNLNYTINFKYNKSYNFLTTGDSLLKIDSFVMHNQHQDDRFIKLNELKVDASTSLNNDRFDEKTQANFNLIVTKNGKEQELGHLKLDGGFQLDAPSLEEYMYYLTQPDKIDSQEANNVAIKLFRKNPQLHINELSIKNSEGKNNIKWIMNLQTEDVDFDKKNINLLELFQSLVNSKFNLNIDINSAKKLISQVMILDDVSEDEALNQAKNTINRLVNEVKSSHYFVVDKNNIKLNAEIDEGKLILNGNPLSNSEVQGMIFALILGLGML